MTPNAGMSLEDVIAHFVQRLKDDGQMPVEVEVAGLQVKGHGWFVVVLSDGSHMDLHVGTGGLQ